MQKPTSEAETAPLRVVIVTLDGHLAGAVQRAQRILRQDVPGLVLRMHAAVEWSEDPAALARTKADIAQADILIVTMLFMEDQIKAVLPDLMARRDQCYALVGCLASGEIVNLTKLGNFTFQGSDRGPLALLKRLRGDKNKGDKPTAGAGAQQMAMLRRLPRILRLIPGKAQDLRAYFLTLQYWLAGSDDNLINMIRYLVDRYAAGPHAALRGKVKAAGPVDYPDVGLYHPRLPGRVTDRLDKLPALDPALADKGVKGVVGVLVMRSYVLAGNTQHYDAVIAALESRGLRVVPAYSSGLDNRPAVEAYFMRNGRSTVDLMLSLTGFSLVGGPAYNDARAAEETLAALDVPYMTTHAVEFQTLAQWEESARGLMPVESTMMVAIPELDGCINPMLYGGRADDGEASDGPGREMVPHPERVETLADRVLRLVTLRRTPPAERKVAVVLFNFPPNAGATGTAAYLSVYASLLNTLRAMAQAGYQVEVPESEDALRTRILGGNAAQFGAPANVHARIRTDDHVRRERWLSEIEAQWGPAPGRDLTDGASLYILGAEFGNVFVGIQPTFGYEGDPMRLLFEKGFSPTHAFSAFYRYLREDLGAHAVVHFGMHGALEFMPGKQSGLSGKCWPERLIGDLPNMYLYASNNPSEGALAKRRAAATLITYLTPSVTEAGLHKGLLELKSSLERYRGLPPEADDERGRMVGLIQAQAADVNLADAEPLWGDDARERIEKLVGQVLEVEQTLIPHGLHVIGKPPGPEERTDLLMAVCEASHGQRAPRAAIEALVNGESPARALAAGGLPADHALKDVFVELVGMNTLLGQDHELPALMRALDGRYIHPAPGGDLLRTTAVLPTGRNMHGFDPWRLPSRFAVEDGMRHATLMLQRHVADGNPLPESVAMVLWGTDNLKNEGGPIAQALGLMGARPRFDGYGRLAGADLIPLDVLGRPRIDVIMTLSGIFRDLLPLQTKLLAEAAQLAARAEEPEDMNYVRKHALAYMKTHGCDMETAALRVFSNADGAYGSNVNQLIDSGRWNDEDELAEAFTRRKSFAYGTNGKPTAQGALFQTMLADVNLAYQNLESMELGVTTIDHYFDTLGGISKAVGRAKGEQIPVYIGDQTKGDGKVRTLAEQVALETRTRVLNPKWYEGMLAHGYEGVRQIEAHVTNTMGWSATTGQVAPWVYQQLTQTFLLDEEMRKRLAALNPTASARVANRLLEAHERKYWEPDEAMLEALRRAGEELEDNLENVSEGVAA
ncbi:magnesium chelatase subunit H [Pararhodospirillum oryzae]|uniref:magnesium chelatase n=1 Tax=Pararhodospirillum oryzae TaxID=478448 RepID=A0A512H524_9PROT|nr:magnesium chelatase subunit H [Pararhodospirillum oryzae]GEO80524.1 magnesium chelatase subunit H [Pararhodospirillum oryzae]